MTNGRDGRGAGKGIARSDPNSSVPPSGRIQHGAASAWAGRPTDSNESIPGRDGQHLLLRALLSD